MQNVILHVKKLFEDCNDDQMILTKNGKTPAYIIDSDFQIVYANSAFRRIVSDLQLGVRCYELICGGTEQCVNCPLKKENQGCAVVFSQVHGECVKASAADIEWPGEENCHVIMIDDALGKGKNFFYNAVGKADYEELLEVNYAADTYHVMYHGKRTESGAHTTGKISTMVRYVAERVIHPDDRQRFYDFWLLDRVGGPLPKELLKPRHSEFRRLRPDGSYGWAQQVFMPAKQSDSDALHIMSFHNWLDKAGEWDPQGGDVLRTLTDNGLLDKQGFFEAVEKFLRADTSRETAWCMLAIDIENLKLFNEWYGRNEGDELIAGVANCLQGMADVEYSIGGYFGNDDFGLMMPYDEARIERLNSDLNTLLETCGNKIGFLPAIGVYEITDTREPAFTMYDRAELARAAVKGDYRVRVKKFDKGMLDSLTSKYILYSDIKRALREKEFTFYLQPKCNIETGKIMGAEALVRWINKDGTMVSPANFIPFLEKSGFITELDLYVWEEVCRWQRSILDRGYQPVPVSVNVSRVDIYSMDIPAYFTELLRRYELDTKLIEIEITESTYTEDNEYVNEVVTDLRKAGFRVLMDDFGSGYSSLNMLKDVEVDVLKVDMRFLNIDENNANRGIGILQAVHNMARLMGTDIIAEGVETKEQKEFLMRMGCGYAQGYYFYRPMAISSFEKAIEDRGNLDHEGHRARESEQFFLKDLLSEDMFSEIMINNMLGAVAFYEVCNDEITVRRFNQHYADLVGNPVNPGTKLNCKEHLSEKDYPSILKMFRDAKENRNEGAESEMRRRWPDGTIRWLHLRTFFMKEQDGRAIYYSSASDVTEIHRKNEALQQQNLALRFLNDDMPGGYYRVRNNADADFLFISKRFLDIVGFTREEMQRYFQGKFMNLVHPDDRSMVRQSVLALNQTGGDHSLSYRIRHKNGYIVITDQSRLVRYQDREFMQGIILYDLHQYRPMGEDGAYEAFNGEAYEPGQYDLNLAPCGIYQAEADGDHRFCYVSSSLLNMLGYTRKAFEEKFPSTQDFVYKVDLERIDSEIVEQIQHGPLISCEHRVEMVDGSLKWLFSRGRMTVGADGRRLFNVCVMDYDYLKQKYRKQELQQMKYKTLAEIPGMLVYDFDPELDRMTIERSLADGTLQSMVVDRFIENIRDHPWLARDRAEEQKQAMQAASKREMSGVSEFKARFDGDETFRWYRAYFRSLVDEDGVYRVVGRADCVDREKKSIHTWQDLAMRDRMTGLLNNESGKEMMERAAQRDQSGTLILLDVDDFKGINDTLGHQKGDMVLKEIAEAIRTTFREEDVLSRLGGDEFLIFMPRASDETVARKKAESLLEKIKGISLDGDKTVQCSVGIAIGFESVAVDMLLREADIALYRAKREGKNKYVFFT